MKIAWSGTLQMDHDNIENSNENEVCMAQKIMFSIGVIILIFICTAAIINKN